LEGGSHLIDDEVKLVALIFLGAFGIVVVYPIFASSMVEPFSELAILGPNGKIGDYPLNVTANESINLSIYVGNQEGKSVYYQVKAKLGDESSDISDTTALNVPPLAVWNIVLSNGQNITMPITLRFEAPGSDKRLVLELYKYNIVSGALEYDHEWIQIWLNIT
jgi:uncharacterized membrane protein